MTNVIHTIVHWLEQRCDRVPGTDEVAAREASPELETPAAAAEWLQRYMFDREWRADVESISPRT